MVPNKGEETEPIEKLSGLRTKIAMKQLHHFGCPTYVLGTDLQAGKKGGRIWKDQASLGWI